MSYLRLHQSSSHCFPCPGSLRPCPIQLSGPPKLLVGLFHTNGLSWLMLQIFLKSLKQAASGFGIPCTSLSGPRPGITSSQPWFAAWPLLGTSKPSTSTADCFVAHAMWPQSEYKQRVTLDCTSQKAPDTTIPGRQLQITLSTTQPRPEVTHSRGRLSGHHSPTKLSPASWGGPLCS